MVSASSGCFWGLVLEPNKDYTHNVSKAFRITMAVLDISSGSNNSPVTVYAKVDKVDYIVCNLESKNYQQSLNLNFDSGVVTFRVKGGRAVHLTGYLLNESSSMKRKVTFDKGLTGGKKSRLTSDIFVDDDEMSDEDSLDEELDDMDSDELDEMMDEEQSSEEDSEEEFASLMMNKTKDLGNEAKARVTTPKTSKAVGSNKSLSPSNENKESKKPKQTPKSENKEKKVVQPATPHPKSTAPAVDSSTKDSNKKQKKKKSLGNETLNGADQATPKLGSAKKTLKGGIVVQDLLVGTGPEVVTGKKVGIYYVGKFHDTQKLFDSRSTGKPLQLKVGSGEMIEGLDRGLVGMKVGGKRRLVVPPKLAYGSEGVEPEIPPNSTLTFDIDLKFVS